MEGLTAGVSTLGQTSPTYKSSQYPLAALNRDMWVIVTGAVPGGDTGALQQQTLTTMQRHAGIATRFTATPQNHRPEFKTVIVFNGSSRVAADALCRNPIAQAGSASSVSEIQVQAVFCRYDAFLSEVEGRVGGGNNLANPNFNALIRQTMTDLYLAPGEEKRNEPED